MPVDEQTAAFLDMLRASGGKPVAEGTVDDARANMARGAALAAPPADVEVGERRIDVAGGSIAVRIYTPKEARPATGFPIVLHYHGGGYVLGNLDSHDAIARYHCAHASAVVVSVDYRLAPEARFPTAVDDCFAALTWAAAHAREIHGDAARIAVTGDSAGGCLATAMCQLARGRGPRIAFQALVYPVTDFRPGQAYPSLAEFGGGEYFLSNADMAWMRDHYVADAAKDVLDPRASPLLEPSLDGMPPAVVVTAGCDPLRDEGRAYAVRLAAAGVPVEYRCFDTTIHACMSFAGAIPAGLEMLDFVAARLRTALHAR